MCINHSLSCWLKNIKCNKIKSNYPEVYWNYIAVDSIFSHIISNNNKQIYFSNIVKSINSFQNLSREDSFKN
jgi:DNA-directed RNA polymerase delta subunit